MGIIQEIQEDLLKDNVKLSVILRKAYIPAVKLNLLNLKEWLDKETQGYEFNDELPQYRKIQGCCKALNPFYGWSIVNFHSKQAEQELSIVPYGKTVFEIEDMLDKTSYTEFQVQLTTDLIAKYGITGCNSLVSVFPRRKLANIINGAKSFLMAYIAKLDDVGIIGKDSEFTMEEKNKAQTVVHQTINVSGGNFMNQVATINSKQIQNNSLDIKQVKELYELILNNINKIGLDEGRISLLEKEMQTLKIELEKETHNPSLIQQSLQSIKNIIEGATGSIVGQAIMHSLKLLGC